jgi:hypothetical protein
VSRRNAYFKYFRAVRTYRSSAQSAICKDTQSICARMSTLLEQIQCIHQLHAVHTMRCRDCLKEWQRRRSLTRNSDQICKIAHRPLSER